MPRNATETITATQYRAKGKPRRDHEHREQVQLINWCESHKDIIPELGLIYAVPNAGKRSRAAGGKAKAEGLKAGVPDLVLPVPRGRYAALYIEMKVKGNTTTPAQEKWIEALRKAGNKAEVCYGWESARDTIMDYLGVTT